MLLQNSTIFYYEAFKTFTAHENLNTTEKVWEEEREK